MVIHLSNVDTWLYHTGVCTRRFDCKTDSSVMQTFGCLIGVCIRRLDSNTDTSVMWTLGSAPLVSVSGGPTVKQTPL